MLQNSSLPDTELHAIAQHLEILGADVEAAEQHTDLGWRVGFPGDSVAFERLVAPLRVPGIFATRQRLDAAIRAVSAVLSDVDFVKLLAVANDRRAQKLSQLD